jgi:hypothetical protein
MVAPQHVRWNDQQQQPQQHHHHHDDHPPAGEPRLFEICDAYVTLGDVLDLDEREEEYHDCASGQVLACCSDGIIFRGQRYESVQQMSDYGLVASSNCALLPACEVLAAAAATHADPGVNHQPLAPLTTSMFEVRIEVNGVDFIVTMDPGALASFIATRTFMMLVKRVREADPGPQKADKMLLLQQPLE